MSEKKYSIQIDGFNRRPANDEDEIICISSDEEGEVVNTNNEYERFDEMDIGLLNIKREFLEGCLKESSNETMLNQTPSVKNDSNFTNLFSSPSTSVETNPQSLYSSTDPLFGFEPNESQQSISTPRPHQSERLQNSLYQSSPNYIAMPPIFSPIYSKSPTTSNFNNFDEETTQTKHQSNMRSSSVATTRTSFTSPCASTEENDLTSQVSFTKNQLHFSEFETNDTSNQMLDNQFSGDTTDDEIQYDGIQNATNQDKDETINTLQKELEYERLFKNKLQEKFESLAEKVERLEEQKKNTLSRNKEHRDSRGKSNKYKKHSRSRSRSYNKKYRSRSRDRYIKKRDREESRHR